MLKILSNKKIRQIIEDRGARIQYKTLSFDNLEGSLTVIDSDHNGLLGKEDFLTSIKAVEEFLNGKKEKEDV